MDVKNCPDCGVTIEDNVELCSTCKAREEAFKAKVIDWKEKNNG